MAGHEPEGGIMRGLRIAARGVLLALAVAAAVLLAAPAYGATVFVEVSPSTAQAGTRVHVRASCDDPTDRQAVVQSDAFGRLIVMREQDRVLSTASPSGDVLVGSVVIPGSKAPGTYSVNLECENGRTASTTLTVSNMTQPTVGPATGAGGTAGLSLGTLLLAGGVTMIAVGAGLGLFGARRRRG
jgi:hypothetical protein